MFLVSTTLSGNSSAVIEDALRSVSSWVDACLLIDTGISDDTEARARALVGDKLVVRPFPWQNDFAKARNFALDAAHELGANWAVTLDTDERIDVGDVDVRSVLAQSKAGCLLVAHDSRTYAKERFFRLPCPVRFVGPTHEAFAAYEVGSETLSGVTFRELPKTEEQLKRKFERDARILEKWTEKHPRDPRWFYYLGDAYASLGKLDKAIDAFRRCANLRGWSEESAWACYRAAECLNKKGRHQDAIDSCAAGLARHAGIAELAWLAAYSAFQAGKHEQAACWANLAVPMGYFRGLGAKLGRIGFRNPAALYEGPYDVLRFALRALGDEDGADEAERLYREAEAARLFGAAVPAPET